MSYLALFFILATPVFFLLVSIVLFWIVMTATTEPDLSQWTYPAPIDPPPAAVATPPAPEPARPDPPPYKSEYQRKIELLDEQRRQIPIDFPLWLIEMARRRAIPYTYADISAFRDWVMLIISHCEAAHNSYYPINRVYAELRRHPAAVKRAGGKNFFHALSKELVTLGLLIPNRAPLAYKLKPGAAANLYPIQQQAEPNHNGN